jgi:multidrug transporter EmrE-like cation transporter
MAGGQMLFKSAALRMPREVPFLQSLLNLLQNWQFLAAVAIYFLLTIVWVWILRVVPLSRAYPFVALAFALAPLLGSFWFGEPLPVRLLAGLAIILCGLSLVAV